MSATAARLQKIGKELTKKEVLYSYRKLLKHAQTLKLTDPQVFKRRVRSEFKSNKNVQQEELRAIYYLVFEIKIFITNREPHGC